jgi:coproporphyrinogen III oxidase
VCEKGGVNVSKVYGQLPEPMKTYLKVEQVDFFACGISLVIHPNSPLVPTVHANFRYFELYDNNKEVVDQWFGGGIDLTPYYLFNEDVVHFHQQCKSVCDGHDPAFYQTFKDKCDRYFWNTHRNEARGVGGLFFDYCRATDERSIEQWFDFVTSAGDAFLDCYTPIVNKRKDLPFGPEQRNWQELRRGRYVEFNLIHDKGTLFGLKTQGRIESILMSLPPAVQWKYNVSPAPDSEEERLVRVLQKPINWIKQ